jgi:hypothetical protein
MKDIQLALADPHAGNEPGGVRNATVYRFVRVILAK